MHLTLKHNARFQPLHRSKWEDVLREMLGKDRMGGITGGRSAQHPDGAIAYCAMDIHLKRDHPENITRRGSLFKEAGLPKDSVLWGTEPAVDMGTSEELAYDANGTERSAEVYANWDINPAIAHREQAMEGKDACTATGKETLIQPFISTEARMPK